MGALMKALQNLGRKLTGQEIKKYDLISKTIDDIADKYPEGVVPITANPEGEPTEDLSKLGIDGIVYGVGGTKPQEYLHLIRFYSNGVVNTSGSNTIEFDCIGYIKNTSNEYINSITKLLNMPKIIPAKGIADIKISNIHTGVGYITNIFPNKDNDQVTIQFACMRSNTTPNTPSINGYQIPNISSINAIRVSDEIYPL